MSLIVEDNNSVAVSAKSAPYQRLAENSPQAAVISKVGSTEHTPTQQINVAEPHRRCDCTQDYGFNPLDSNRSGGAALRLVRNWCAPMRHSPGAALTHGARE
jgi:hypothetical protein